MFKTKRTSDYEEQSSKDPYLQKADERFYRLEQLNESEDRINGYFYPESESNLSISFMNQNYSLENGYEKIEFRLDGTCYFRRRDGLYSSKRLSFELFYAFEEDNSPPIVRDFYLHPLGRGEFSNGGFGNLQIRLGKTDIYSVYNIIKNNFGLCYIEFRGPVKDDKKETTFYIDTFDIKTGVEKLSLEQLNEDR